MLVSSAKKVDFCNLFLLQDSIPFSVDYFYQWLVINDVGSNVLEEVAAAVQSREVESRLDVSVAQMFVSRTKQQCRREGSPRKESATALSINYGIEDDDDDEL